VSFEVFIDTVAKINAGEAKPRDFDHHLATIGTTILTTAILEAGRKSLDARGQPFAIQYDDSSDWSNPTGIIGISY